MIMYPDIKLTNKALSRIRELIFDNTGTERLVFTHVAVGDGVLPEGTAEEDREALAHEVHRSPIETFSKELTSGRVSMSARLATDMLVADLIHRETGVYAMGADGREFLFAYCNAGDAYDYIPASGSTAAVYKSITVSFDVGELRTIFRDLPSDDLVSFAAFNTRLNQLLPELVDEKFEEVRGEITGYVSESKTAAEKAELMADCAEGHAGQAKEDKEAAAEYAVTAETAAGNAAQSESIAREKAEGASASAEQAEQSAERANLSAEDVKRIAAEVLAMSKEIVPPRLNYNGNHFYFNKFTEPEYPDDKCVYPYFYLKKMLGGRDNYQLWLDAGNTGTLEDFLETQKGPPGDGKELEELKSQLESKTEAVWISEEDYRNLAVKNPQTLYIIN